MIFYDLRGILQIKEDRPNGMPTVPGTAKGAWQAVLPREGDKPSILLLLILLRLRSCTRGSSLLTTTSSPGESPFHRTLLSPFSTISYAPALARLPLRVSCLEGPPNSLLSFQWPCSPPNMGWAAPSGCRRQSCSWHRPVAGQKSTQPDQPPR